MSRSSGCRAAVEPVAALVALFAVCVGVSLYAGVLDAALDPTARDVAPAARDRVHEAVTDAAGVADPDELGNALVAGPTGYNVNATLSTGGDRWSVGPTAPPGASTAHRPVSVRVGPGEIRSGRLRVVVWP